MNAEYVPKIRRIAVVDDDQANRNAAVSAIKELFPEALVVEFDNAAEAITSIDTPSETNPLPDFVLSDMRMEEEQSGWQVATAAWSWRVPVAVVSGGVKGHGKDLVILGYPHHQFPGEKNDSNLWKQIILAALDGDHTTNGLLQALRIGKRDSPDRKFGEAVSVVSVGHVLFQQGE